MSDYSNRECKHGTYLGTPDSCGECRADLDALLSNPSAKDMEIERLQARIEELEAHKKTLSKAVMELSELVPDKKFWACPTCTAVNPEQRKLCVNGCGRDRAATEQGGKDE